MKFRMIWIGSEDDPGKHARAPEQIAGRPQKLDGVRYEQRDAGMVRREQLRNGDIRLVPVANFTARIVRDIVLEDDNEQQREFGLEAEVAGQKISFVVPAEEFRRMGWVLRQLGPRAIIYPGQLQHARAAIQWLSGSIHSERIFTQLGWRKHGSGWVYLQSGGPVGLEGTSSNWQVQLPAALQNYRMPPPRDHDALVKAIRSSLRFLAVAPDRVSVPLLAAVYRAPLGQVDFSVFLTGRTGTFKTALAALCQQHFGAAMDASRLPANFASTANALEELAFSAQDALMVVDDFVPTGGRDDPELHAKAERLFRAAGNRQGRSRMSGPRLRAAKPPRTLFLATGEEVPRGHSLRSRLLIVELRPSEVDQSMLSRCQGAGQNGLLATAMNGYLTWMAPRYDVLQEQLHTRLRELRSRSQQPTNSVHARLPTAIAELQSGWEVGLQFACEVGAIDKAERVELQRRTGQALEELAAAQICYHQASDPALRFLALLQAALCTGRAHVADRLGQVPDGPEQWGWRRKPSGRAWAPQGTRIGWLAAADLFLDPVASYESAQAVAGAERLPVSSQTLRHRLREHGLLLSVDRGRQMLLVRRTLENVPRQVLHLRAGDVSGFSQKRLILAFGSVHCRVWRVSRTN